MGGSEVFKELWTSLHEGSINPEASADNDTDLYRDNVSTTHSTSSTTDTTDVSSSIQLMEDCLTSLYSFDQPGIDEASRNVSKSDPSEETARSAPLQDQTKDRDNSSSEENEPSKSINTGENDAGPEATSDDQQLTFTTAKLFQAFIEEMKDFKQNTSCLKTRAEIAQYANYIEIKYLAKFDGMSTTDASATKSRRVIEGFVQKLRERINESKPIASSSNSEPWSCAVCSKLNENAHNTCITCGRKKGYAGKKKAPPKPVHVPIINKESRAKKTNKTSLDRKKDLFLKNKSDYEVDAREEIADEISQVLESVVRSNIL